MTSDKRPPACRRLFPDADDSTDDNHNTATEFYTQEVERFKDRWNFDPTTGRPMLGNYRWQGSEEQEGEEGVENDEPEERHGRFESTVDSEELNAPTSSAGTDLRPTPMRADSQPVISSLEAESSIDVTTTSPVTSLSVASADPAPSTVASRDAEASADWSESSASVLDDSGPGDVVVDQKSSSMTSPMTSSMTSSSSEIPVTSGSDGDVAGDTKRRQREIKVVHSRCKKLKASRISSKDEDKDSERKGPISSLSESP